MEQMDRSLKYKRDRDDDAIREFLPSHEGMVTMTSLRLALDGMAAEEKTQYQRRSGLLSQNQNQLRRGFLLLVGLNLLLVTLGGIFLNQEARRRRNDAQEAEGRNVQLAQAVNERTAELTGLSHHLQRLQEEEKAKLAREIHDELGGTLAAAKIDLQLLSDKLSGGDAQRSRLLRIMSAIDDTIQVKRRIIEDLRPTLLDNLGIGAALKWQCSQFSKRWNIPCRIETPDDSLRLSPAYSIAFYRVVQEALTNISKYASGEERHRFAVAGRRPMDAAHRRRRRRHRRVDAAQHYGPWARVHAGARARLGRRILRPRPTGTRHGGRNPRPGRKGTGGLIARLASRARVSSAKSDDSSRGLRRAGIRTEMPGGGVGGRHERFFRLRSVMP
jgi:hypothetical protein